MAEYEPYPTGSGQVEGDRDLAKKVVGCFGVGSLGVIGAVVAAMVVLGALGSLASGCDVELGDPGDGSDSQRLAVGVAPKEELTDGATVRVTSTAFEPSTVVGVAVCLRAADTQRKGVQACDERQGARFATTDRGELDATYAVPRVITVGGTAYDCAAKAGACLVVAADAGDYDQSGGQPVSFRTDLPAADLTPVTDRPVSDHLPIGAEPSVEGTAVAAGTELTILASGFQPGEPLLVAYCTSKVEQEGIIEQCTPTDSGAAVTAILGRSVEDAKDRADASGAFTTTLPAKATVLPVLGGGDEGTTTSGSGKLQPGEVRCTEAAGGCTILVTAAADTKRSAILPYAVTG